MRHTFGQTPLSGFPVHDRIRECYEGRKHAVSQPTNACTRCLRLQVVLEVSKPSSGNLMKTVSGLPAEPVLDMTNRLLAQCMQQGGLTKVYRKLMRHTGTIINLRQYPELDGLPMRAIRRGFRDAVVAGLIRDEQVSKWSCLSTAGGIPLLGYPAGRVATPASPGRPPR
jgi:hypothetical protein